MSDATRRAARELATDVVITAGAGTGKTYTLVQVAVHLCAGTSALGRRVRPGRLLALTFGEKAAAELRDRIRARFLELAERPREDVELEEAYARTGTAPLAGEEWRQCAEDVGGAPISTFHSFAAGLLRRHAAAAGLDPAFVLLEEDEAAGLRRAAAEEATLAALDRAEVRALVRELDYSRGADGRGRGLVEHVIDVAARLAEEGKRAGELAARCDDPAAAEAAYAEAAGRYRTALADLEAALTPERGKRVSERIAELAGLIARRRPVVDAALAAAGPEQDPEGIAVIAELRDAMEGNIGNGGRTAARQRLRDALGAMREAHVSCRAAPLLGAFADVVAAAERGYEEAKASAGALDFTDLLLRARDLLARDAAAREDAQGRHDAILVDEFQDTNDLQHELVELARGPGVPRLVVGDPKQSIYEFRGADVAVFGRVAAEVAASGGQILPLTESRRGRAPLVEVVNRLFARAMRGGAHPFEIGFDPERDALTAWRGGDGIAVELLEAGRDEAAAVAQAIRAVVDGERAVFERTAEGGERARPARYGDVAVLLRRFTHLDAFLAALRRVGVPHYVVNGRGFHEAQEVRDLCHALALVDDPDDALALFGILRSPLVGLSDAALVALAELSPRRTSGAPGALALAPLLQLRPGAAPPGLAADEAERLGRFLELYRRLRRHADRLGAAGVLRALVEETDLAALLATTFHGQQRVANLERLLWLAEAHDEAGRGDRRAFARALRAQVDRERSLAAPAQVLGEGEDVVRVMTVHQAKGLEFPVVFVPECGAVEREPNGALVYDRAAGVGLRLKLDAGAPAVASRRAREAQELRRARARAESLRLFYVATTRARDLLVLSGAAPSATSPCWRRHVDELLAEDEAARALCGTAAAPPAATTERRACLAEREPAVAAGAPFGASDPALEAWAADLVAPPRTGARTLVAPVTELMDFAGCPRRFRLRHEVGLGEHPAPPVVEPRDGDGGAPGGELDALGRGTLAHRLLERIDLRAWAARGAPVLDELLRAEAPGLAAADAAEVRRSVTAFLASSFGRSLAERPPDSRAREEPFVLALDAPGGTRLLLKGQIDLVLFDGDVVTVLDYKLARPGARDYDFQLKTYAAAARALWGRPARAGLVYLREKTPAPRFLELTEAELRFHAAELAGIAASLAEARRTGTFAGRPVAACQALRCGYAARCHPGGGPR